MKRYLQMQKCKQQQQKKNIKTVEPRNNTIDDTFSLSFSSFLVFVFCFLDFWNIILIIIFNL